VLWMTLHAARQLLILVVWTMLRPVACLLLPLHPPPFPRAHP
jgi:hypothetical protein